MKNQPFENPDLMDILSENHAKIIKALFSDDAYIKGEGVYKMRGCDPSLSQKIHDLSKKENSHTAHGAERDPD